MVFSNELNYVIDDMNKYSSSKDRDMNLFCDHHNGLGLRHNSKCDGNTCVDEINVSLYDE